MFFRRVYKEWKFLFWVIFFFMAGQCFFMFKGIQNAPFFLYHMFSTIHPPQDSMPVYLLKSRDGYISPFEYTNREGEMLTNYLSYYDQMKQNNYADPIFPTIEKRFKNRVSPGTFHFIVTGLSNDSAAVNRYPKWWAAYFKSVMKEKYDSVWVVKSYVYNKPAYAKSPVDSIIFSVSVK